MNEFDELQSLRSEVAKLREENGDLGEKLGAAYNDIAILRHACSRAWDEINWRIKPNACNILCDALDKTNPLTRNAAVSSTAEPSLYKGQVAGSNPAPPTI